MNDERTLLLAVEKDARSILAMAHNHRVSGRAAHWTEEIESCLGDSIDSIDAYRAQQKVDEPKTVLVRAVVIMSPCGEFWTVAGADNWDDAEAERMASKYAISEEVRAAVIVAQVRPPTTPVVTGSVET